MCVSAKFLNACFCNFAACPVGTRHAVSANFSKGTSRWKRSTGTFPKSRHYKRQTGRSGLVRSALEKLSLFSPTFSVRPKARAQGVSLSADSDLEGACPLRTPRQLRSAGAAFSGTVFQNLFASARCFFHPPKTAIFPEPCPFLPISLTHPRKSGIIEATQQHILL